MRKWRETGLFDIDKELKAIGAKKYKPDEDLRQRTRNMVTRAACAGHSKKPAARRFLYYPAIAAALAVIMLISVFSAAPAKAAGYYTIDINPSISVAVDGRDNVLSVSAKNDDAKELLSGLELDGLTFEEALKVIVEAAARKQYLKDEGHLLVAYFGDDEGLSQQELETIVNEQLPEIGVAALLIRGKIEDYEKAEKSGKKAGIELLLSGAHEAGIDDEDIGSVIDDMSKKQKDKDANPGGKGKNNADGVQGPANSDNNGNGGNNDNNGNGGNNDNNGNNGNSGSNSSQNADKDKEKEDKEKDKDKDKEKDNKDKDNEEDKQDKNKDKDNG